MDIHPTSTWPASVDEHIKPMLDSSALIIIDTQNDFVDGGASPIAGTSAIVPALRSLQAAFRAAGRPIVHVVRIYRGDGEDVDRVRRGAIASGTRIVAPDTDGAQVVPGLSRDWRLKPSARSLLNGDIVEVNDAEFVMWKPRWSAFHRTRLHDFLQGLGITTVVIAGCNFPNCPRATIFDSSSGDYRVLVPSDALSNISGSHLEELGRIGVLHAITGRIIDELGLTTSSPGP
ncbi:hypothetical protein A1O3_06013 [Capronia epimyces CBS 606.96]|uniref:Isochorismatase-like domain-containing protein n=1 Tax=Capronia epimyces CBS 606.96 TaxID=1182542 RepID=W9XXU7_9EURO|nr:uncharacterized protein A1O3_06013 [Capronia epimyces CBS 606.96]EXJ82200.1 hypothetical protein A1O3_06013 [Capronia epimyces CBS 606.96]